MKRLIGFLISMTFILSLCACGSSFAQVDLQDTIMISETGIIEKTIFKTIQENNAIGSFQGESNGFTYEWTIFGTDISEVRDLNLAVDVKQEKEGVLISLKEDKPFGFPALLSIHLHETWDSMTATAYQQEQAIYSVSLTGTESTILNISINDNVGNFLILPDEEIQEFILEVDAVTDEDESEMVEELVNEVKNTNTYLTAVQNGDHRVYSDGSATEKDEYLTDPVPEGKPMPVEPEEQTLNEEKTSTCTFSIECSTILNNLTDLDPDKLEMVPSNGVILDQTTVTFYEGESVFDVLQRVCQENDIHIESSWTPIYNSAYVEGIHNLYEFDCGNLSGWMYRVNGWYPNYGSSRYQLAQGDVVEWRYTCDLGKDIGGGNFE